MYMYTQQHKIRKNPLIQTLPCTLAQRGRKQTGFVENYFFFRFCVWKIASFLAHINVVQSKCYKFLRYMFIYLTRASQHFHGWRFILRISYTNVAVWDVYKYTYVMLFYLRRLMCFALFVILSLFTVYVEQLHIFIMFVCIKYLFLKLSTTYLNCRLVLTVIVLNPSFSDEIDLIFCSNFRKLNSI